jgi:hypothetical protein
MLLHRSVNAYVDGAARTIWRQTLGSFVRGSLNASGSNLDTVYGMWYYRFCSVHAM